MEGRMDEGSGDGGVERLNTVWVTNPERHTVMIDEVKARVRTHTHSNAHTHKISVEIAFAANTCPVLPLQEEL